MHRQLTELLLAMGMVFALAQTVSAAGATKIPIAICFIHEHSVFAVDRGERFSEATVLFEAKTASPGAAPPTVERHEYGQMVTYTIPYRWRIAQGVFWGTGATVESLMHTIRRVPVEDLPLSREPFSREQRSALAKRYPGYKSGFGFALFEWDLGPMREIYYSRAGYHGLSMPDLNPPMYFDILPVGKTTLLMFVLGGGKMRVWQGSGKWSEKTANWETEWKRKAEEDVAAGFLEPFFAYSAGDTYFFVTVSGKLFAAPKPDEGVRDAEAVWRDVRQPIRVVLTDTASQTTFAFTRPDPDEGGKGESVYFPLANKLRPTAYDPDRLPKVKVEGPLKEVLPLAQFLLAEKRIR
jgi:hypothetical protein